jgi:diadenosine tetraphosphate (Ap4A) HIT family hydrolase
MAWQGDAFERNLVGDFPLWGVFAHDQQSYLGRTYIALVREGDVDPVVDTTPEEREQLHIIKVGLHAVLAELYHPDRLNYAILGNEWPHLHEHVIPRYQTPREVGGVTFIDHNWGKNYTPYDEGFQIPEAVFDKIKADLSAGIADSVKL